MDNEKSYKIWKKRQIEQLFFSILAFSIGIALTALVSCFVPMSAKMETASSIVSGCLLLAVVKIYLNKKYKKHES
jgi:hypothetical protein